MVAMAADYRVSSRHKTKADKCTADAKSAVRWIRKHAARLGVDPQRVAAGGGSAGGHLAACTGVVPGFDEPGEDTEISSVPNALALFNPALILANVNGRAPFEAERIAGISARMGTDPVKLSPYHHVAKGAPPTIIFHGTGDTTVAFWTAELFAEAMQKAGNRCELVAANGQPHGFFNFGRDNNVPYRQTVHALDKFLASVGFLEGEPTIELPKPASTAARQRQLWITNAYGNDVHIYDVATWELVRHIEVGLNPHGISATADGRTAHIAIENFRTDVGELVWVDTRSGKITHRIDVGPRPNENECTPDGKWIYVPCADGHWWVVDGEKKEVVTRIETGGRPHNTVVSPDGKRMYLSPMGGPKRVTVVDIDAGHKVIGEIPFDNVTRPPAISSDEKRFFQNIDGLLGFQVADVAARKVVRTVEHTIPEQLQGKKSRCHGLGVRPDQAEIWSCDVEHHLVHVHELDSGEYRQTATLEMPGRIYWVCFTPDSRYAFVSVRSEQKVAVVDCRTKEIVKLLDAGREPKRTQVIDVPVE